jgi:hypothetical protein
MLAWDKMHFSWAKNLFQPQAESYKISEDNSLLGSSRYSLTLGIKYIGEPVSLFLS